MLGFEKIAGFPGVFGVIDGTHIKVKVPREKEERFQNRKSDVTVNCQMVFGNQMRLMNLNARWPESSHGARIFRESELYPLLENGSYPGHLPADSAHPLREYVMTPDCGSSIDSGK